MSPSDWEHVAWCAGQRAWDAWRQGDQARALREGNTSADLHQFLGNSSPAGLQ